MIPRYSFPENKIPGSLTSTENLSNIKSSFMVDEQVSEENFQKCAYEATGHADINDDNHCDVCDEIIDVTKNCKCGCHKNIFVKLVLTIMDWIFEMFGMNLDCDCGASHC